MNTLSFWKKSVYSALMFFGTLMVLSVGYAVLSSGLSNADKVGSGSGLTAASWNKIIDGIFELDTRTANIFSSGGNVGIGTVSPRAKLQIHGNGFAPSSVDGSPNYYRITPNINQTQLNLGYWANGDWFPTVGIPTMTIKYDGNVGIGTMEPTQKLDVNGNINVNGNIHSNNF